MKNLSFLELGLTPKVKRAIDDMGFETATSIQSQAIPIIRTGVDVIGRSQTGTGKTVAFAIPAIERIDTHEERPTLQVLILCPTRELAQQACSEIKKLTKYKTGVRPVEVYGGASMEKQIFALKRANMVIGTPGRIMDHMRRRTLRLDNIKMVVLDEADEMLSMGFKEDIETILTDTPADRQTVLFSATMPDAIMRLTKEFQKEPKVVEINKAQVTIDNIAQSYVEVPMGRKMDVLCLLLRYHTPRLSMVFCNTKSMVDEVVEHLAAKGFEAEGLHGDMKQAQRTKVMDSFKRGKSTILVATDVAARGIDVNDVDYVINYDIPQNTEYYVHRIGRTGRAGKSGNAITLCSGRRQVFTMRDLARQVKSQINPMSIPSAADIRSREDEQNLTGVKEILTGEIKASYKAMLAKLIEDGHSPEDIAAAALQLHFDATGLNIEDIDVSFEKKHSTAPGTGFAKIQLNIGRNGRVAPNHIVGAITERTSLNGSDIGKIEIYDEVSMVSVPQDKLLQTLDEMTGCKICGRPVSCAEFYQKPAFSVDKRRSNSSAPRQNKGGFKDRFSSPHASKAGAFSERRKPSKSRFTGTN